VLGVVGLVLALVLRSSTSSSHTATTDAIAPTASPTLGESAASTTPPPAPTVTVDRWRLTKTDCPPGAMPPSVETTHTSTTIVSRASGFPDSVGTGSPDGTFHVHNALGTCIGKATDRVVTETCTNKLHLSCHATYERAD
jgi:hypothetical protein